MNVRVSNMEAWNKHIWAFTYIFSSEVVAWDSGAAIIVCMCLWSFEESRKELYRYLPLPFTIYNIRYMTSLLISNPAMRQQQICPNDKTQREKQSVVVCSHTLWAYQTLHKRCISPAPEGQGMILWKKLSAHSGKEDVKMEKDEMKVWDISSHMQSCCDIFAQETNSLPPCESQNIF